MKRFAILLFPLLAAAAQSTLTLTGPASVRAGAVIALNVNLAGAATANGGPPASIEFTLSTGADITAVSGAIGASATAAQKQLVCTALTAGKTSCILYGINVTTMADGVVATLSATLSAVATASQVFTLGTVAPQEADPNGLVITVSSPAAGITIPVLSPCDVTDDGKTDGVDVLAMVNWVLGISQPTAGHHCDMDGNGQCDLRDVSVILQAALGKTCTGH